MKGVPSRDKPRMRCAVLFGWAWYLLAIAAGADPRPQERGYPLLRNYGPGEYHGGTQNFDLAQDPSGLIYAANLHGLMVHDGAWWQKVSLANALAVFCVESDAQGRIAVGGVGEMGLLGTDAGGSLRYESLLPHLPAAEREIGDVWSIHATPRGFVFLTDKALYRWDGSRLIRLASFPDPDARVLTHAVGDRILVWIPDYGRHRVEGDGLAPVPGGDAFRGRRLDVILPAGDDGLLLAVRDEGLRLWDGGRETPVGAAAGERLRRNPATAGAFLPDGRVVIGTRGGGVLVLDAEWDLEVVIDAGSGLPDSVVHALLVDRDRTLWVATDDGLSQVELALPLSVFDQRSGLEGSSEHVARHAGRLWVGTTVGLFALDHGSGVPRMERVAGLPEDRARPLDLGDTLLVGTPLGVFHGSPGRFARVPDTENVVVYGMLRSRRDPDRVWLGTRNGVSSLRRDGRGWALEPAIEDAPRYVVTFVERPDGTLWGGSVVAGVVRIDSAARRVLSSGEGELSVHLVEDRILVPMEDRVLLLDEVSGRPGSDPRLAKLAGHGLVFHLAGDPDGNLWLNTIPPHVARRSPDGSYAAPLPLPSVTADDMQNVLAETDGVVWMMTNRGLFRYAGDVADLETAPPTPLIRRVARVGVGDLYGGAPEAAGRVPTLPFRHGRLRVEFAPASYRPGVAYQYRLDPVEGEWSEWSADAFTEYTQLAEGDYRFRVRGRPPNGEAGPEASWAFAVAPPWYRTPAAWLAWLAGAVLLVGGYARVRTRGLRRHATRLEEVVAARTRELQAANERLDALARRDDLTGLWNRRHLDESLREEWSRARRHAWPLSFVLMDLDHFKELNDALGHARGDACLRRIGDFLKEQVGRGGEVVARYGGEEFGLLLPGTGRAGAARLAERLRDAIAGLDLASEVGFDGVVTASFGVAAAGFPDDGGADGGPEALVEAADRALYRAKSDGRNCVRVDGGETA